MVFNPTYFGYGVGLIIIAWIAGTVIGTVFGAFKKVNKGW
jgi:hypothetical protein